MKRKEKQDTQLHLDTIAQFSEQDEVCVFVCVCACVCLCVCVFVGEETGQKRSVKKKRAQERVEVVCDCV